ncbi:hypothetical protein AMATHDRAFT_48386 [Amanita thiersii Skay4041]|uniref:Uncharacterized protein n=1 Tax=Amanita thiersii Skay4041 TaxID=703135 RepID=A0A2A9NNE8_9AGAR|nr:hypothetical protein AMATHDRAFT_48386 [Amanita thiersii Skay4041]
MASIPFDILCEIFSEVNNPILVASVSRTWRELALYTPGLWSQLTISFCKRHPQNLLELYLERSRDQPLYIDFYCDKVPRTCLSSVLQTIASTAPRVKRLTIYLSSGSFVQLPDIRSYFPKLSSLEVKYYNQPSKSTMFPTIASLTYGFLLTLVPKLSVPWAGIDSLSLSTPDIRAWLLKPIFSLVSPSLTSLSCQFTRQIHIPPPQAPMSLPCLKDLQTNHPFVLELITPQNLSSLQVAIGEYTYEKGTNESHLAASLYSFLRRGAGDTITSFHLTSPQPLSSDMYSALTLLKAVTTLTFSLDPVLPGPLADFLCDPNCMPHLESLHLSVPSAQIEFVSMLGRVLNVRGSKLGKVYLHYAKDVCFPPDVCKLRKEHRNIELWFAW